MAACLFLVGGANAASDPATNGPYAFGEQTVNIPATQNATLSTDLYYPASAGGIDPAAVPCPVLLLGHGFSQSKARHVNQGRQLATRGYIVLIPTFQGGSDHARNGRDLSRCIDWILARNEDSASLLFGAMRPDAIGAGGHSAGGLSAILAAAEDARIRALSLMDPVDNGGQGVAALAAVEVPVAMTWSEPSACNAGGSAEVLFAAAQGTRRGMKVVGANHSDPQDPAGFLSILTCGSPNATRQMLYRRYMAGWFEYFLRGDVGYAPWVFHLPDGPLAADLVAGRVTYQAVTPLELGIAWTNGMAAIEVAGPVGHRFALEGAADQGEWRTLSTNITPATPLIAPLPEVAEEYFRTQSLP